MEPDFEIESLRNQHESDKEWGLRRKFILLNSDKLPFDRLMCLSSVFLNVEMLGCRYPQPVMDDLKVFSEAMLEEIREHRESVLEKTQVKFVKASSNSDDNYSGQPIAQKSNDKPKVLGGMSFVKSSDDYKSTELTTAKHPEKPVEFTREMKKSLPKNKPCKPNISK